MEDEKAGQKREWKAWRGITNAKDILKAHMETVLLKIAHIGVIRHEKNPAGTSLDEASPLLASIYCAGRRFYAYYCRGKQSMLLPSWKS